MSERLLLMLCGIIGAMVLILAVNCEKAEIAAFADEVEQFTEEMDEEPEKRQIPIHTACLAELYERRRNEQTAEEESGRNKDRDASEGDQQGTSEDNGAVPSEMEEVIPVQDENAEICAEEEEIKICIDGDTLDPEVAGYLKRTLEAKGIGWWWPYAICQCHQESSFQTDQVTNGIDYGLFQYRIYYWQEWEDRAGVGHGDILDPYHQIDVYTEMVRQWISEGRSIEETIGAHNYGGWTWDYDPQYVSDVMRWWR